MCQKKANIVLCHQFWHLDKKNPLEINFRYLILSHKVKLLRERPWVFQLVCLESSEMQILGNRLYQHSAEHETAGDTVSFVNQSDLPCAVSPDRHSNTALDCWVVHSRPHLHFWRTLKEHQWHHYLLCALISLHVI